MPLYPAENENERILAKDEADTLRKRMTSAWGIDRHYWGRCPTPARHTPRDFRITTSSTSSVTQPSGAFLQSMVLRVFSSFARTVRVTRSALPHLSHPTLALRVSGPVTASTGLFTLHTRVQSPSVGSGCCRQSKQPGLRWSKEFGLHRFMRDQIQRPSHAAANQVTALWLQPLRPEGPVPHP